MPGARGSAYAQGFVAGVELLLWGVVLQNAEQILSYNKLQAVGFVGTVALSVSQEGINTPDSAAEQLQWAGTPLPWSQSRALLVFLPRHSWTVPLKVQDLSWLSMSPQYLYVGKLFYYLAPACIRVQM